MSRHLLLWLIPMLSGMGMAQAQSTQDKASRLALEVEWVRSPRAVIDIGTTTQKPQSSEKSSLFSEPVELEAHLATAQEAKVWSLGLQDKKLSLALANWAQQAGWQMVWEAERDFVIESSLHLSGDFIQSVGAVMHALATSDYPLQAKANRNTLTLRISRYQDAGNR